MANLGRRGLDEIRLAANQSGAMQRVTHGFVMVSALRDTEAAQVAITPTVFLRSALDTNDVAQRPIGRDST